jgi:hypothetical protein
MPQVLAPGQRPSALIEGGKIEWNVTQLIDL